jgi:hypothetical protein
MGEYGAYDNVSIHVNPRPKPHHRGGWLFWRWTVTASSMEGLSQFKAPAPPNDLSAVVSIVSLSGQSILVEIGEADGDISPEALTYVSMVANELRCCLGEGTAIDGDVNHTMFLLVKWKCGDRKDS